MKIAAIWSAVVKKISEPFMPFNTVPQAELWAAAHPTKTMGEGGPSWHGWCAALMFWSGGFDRSCSTAVAGSRESTLISNNHLAALPGAFHWWRMGSEGHVALDLDGGGTRLLMASNTVTNFGNGIGTTTFATYNGANYAGWSLDFVGQWLSNIDPINQAESYSLADGRILQLIAARGTYRGPIDGVPGPKTWFSLQLQLRRFGYLGPADGVPGKNTYAALQRMARVGGYRGPVDGILGPHTFLGLESSLTL